MRSFRKPCNFCDRLQSEKIFIIGSMKKLYEICILKKSGEVSQRMTDK